MSSAALVASIVALYDYALYPIPALAWMGAPISFLDIAGAFRLALILRQLREVFHRDHLIKVNNRQTLKDRALEPLEQRSRVRDFATNLIMVFGGEAVVAPWLGIQPSFIVSGGYPLLFLSASALIDTIPAVPELSLFTELPLSGVDALTRAVLLCNFIPSMITTHTSPTVSTSPYTLLLTAFIAANAGPLFVNTFSLLRPTPMTFMTPPELLPYGWTATDLWVAPLVTGLYATLTHAQPFWAHLHALLFSFFSPLGLAPLSFPSAKPDAGVVEGVVVPLNANDARAVCVLVLSTLFSLRAVRSFSSVVANFEPSRATLVTSVPTPILSTSEGEKFERELAARVAGAGKGARIDPL